MSVVLPAPLSPRSATTSPSWSDRDAFTSARTLPKDLLTLSSRSTSAAMALAPHRASLQAGMQDQHAEDDRADEDVVGKAGDADQDDAIPDRAEKENAGD